jgi:DNA-directed RNA polymerase specialized sigma24 family protein
VIAMGEGIGLSAVLCVKLTGNNALQTAEQSSADCAALDSSMLATLLEVAASRARQVGRTLRLAAADREDVEQAIVLGVLERRSYFDPERGSWRSFAVLVARQLAQKLADELVVAWNRAGPSLDEQATSPLAMDVPEPASASDASTLHLAVQRFVSELPDHLALVARLAFAEEGDFANAHRLSGLSRAEFYRRLREVRYRLVSLGIVRWPRGPLGRNPPVDRY